MKTSKATLISENKRLDYENNVMALALSDLCNGAVKWFGNSPSFNIGITRPTGAAGGIVIHRNGGMASAHYWEDFSRTELAHIAAVITGEDTEHNHEFLCRRSTIETAQAYISDKIRAL